jgi:hypothetical protein
MLTQDGGKPHPAYAPYMGIISPVLERAQFTSGGYPLVEGLTRDDYRRSYAKMVELAGRLHKAGVTIVAGTHGWGIELIRELEIYQQAGFTPAEALQSATKAQPSSPRAWWAPTHAPARSRWARRRTWCWWTATSQKTSAPSAA